MGVPSASDQPESSGWLASLPARDDDAMQAGWAKNLPPGETRFALQVLTAVDARKFEQDFHNSIFPFTNSCGIGGLKPIKNVFGK
jgi:hypothetical protein